MRGLWRCVRVTSVVAFFLLPGCAIPRAVEAAAYRPQPIPTATGGYTNETFVADWERFQTRNLVEAYARHGRHNPAWDEQAKQYAQAWVRRLCWYSDAESLDRLVAEGKALIAAGCGDPLMQYLYGMACHEQGDAAAAEPLFRRAVDGFEQSTYPRVNAAYAAARVAHICRDATGVKAREGDRYQGAAGRWLAEMCGDGSFVQGEHRLMLYVISEMWNTLWIDRLEALYSALEANEKVHPYVRDVVGGDLYIGLAWEARGGGWADSVTEEGWRAFEGNLAIARKLLTRAWRNYPDCPEAPTAMIRIAMAGHAGPGETERMWFDRAVAAQMDYKPAYDSLIHAMLPRWGGTHEEIYDFGVECARTQRYDTRVPRLYFDCVKTIADDMGGDPEIWRRSEVRELTNTVFGEYEKKADPMWRPSYQSLHAAVAWRGGDYATARRLMDELGDAMDQGCFSREFGADFGWAKAETHAFTGPGGEDLLKAESLATNGSRRKASELYQAALPKVDGVAAPFVRHRAEVLRLEDEFEQGGWVPLRPKPGLAGWRPENGDWTVEPDGALKGVDTGSLWIRCDADFGDRLEFRGDVEFVRAPGQHPDATLALRCPPVTRRDDVMVQLCKRQGVVQLSQSLSRDTMATGKAEIGDRNTFLIQVWDEDVNVSLNGARVMQDEWVEENYPGGKKVIGFGSSYRSERTTLRFRDLTVRKLMKPPGG